MLVIDKSILNYSNPKIGDIVEDLDSRKLNQYVINEISEKGVLLIKIERDDYRVVSGGFSEFNQ